MLEVSIGYYLPQHTRRRAWEGRSGSIRIWVSKDGSRDGSLPSNCHPLAAKASWPKRLFHNRVHVCSIKLECKVFRER